MPAARSSARTARSRPWTAPEPAQGLQILVDAYADGNIPEDAITYNEEESRIAFQDGKPLFMRNWPYVYGLADDRGLVRRSRASSRSPRCPADGPGASTLGGHNAAISAYSDNKATALDFLNFFLEEEQQRIFTRAGSLAPALESLYTDPELVKQYAYLPVLKESIENAVPRPVTPFYPAVTKAIQDNAYAAIKGEKSGEDAIKDMQAAIEAASKQRSDRLRVETAATVAPDHPQLRREAARCPPQRRGTADETSELTEPRQARRARAEDREQIDPHQARRACLLIAADVVLLAIVDRLPGGPRGLDVLPEGRRRSTRPPASSSRAAAPGFELHALAAPAVLATEHRVLPGRHAAAALLGGRLDHRVLHGRHGRHRGRARLRFAMIMNGRSAVAACSAPAC